MGLSPGEIEISNPNRLIEILTDKDLQAVLLDAGLPPKTITDARMSVYARHPPLWTRHLSKYLSDKGILGFLAPSARTNTGNTVVIFEENLQPSDYKINQITDIEITALNTSLKPLKKGQTAHSSILELKSTLVNGHATVLEL